MAESSIEADWGDAWHPIETAPRDGTRVLFCASPDYRGDRVHIGWFNKWGEACWQGLAHNPTPVAWQPLPEPKKSP